MKQASKSELIETILKLGEKLFRELLPTVPRELLAMDLTMPQMKIVLMLYLDGSARMGMLASGLGVTLATATGVVDRLVERGIVVREADPDDRRVVICRLSHEGEKLVSTMWQSSKARCQQLLEIVDQARLLLLAEALEALTNHEIQVKVVGNGKHQAGPVSGL